MSDIPKDVQLVSEGLVPLDLAPTPELEQPQDLGTDEVNVGKFYAKLGDQPLPFSLRNTYEALGQPVPSEFRTFDAYDLWVVPHKIGIIRHGGLAEVTGVGLEIQYETSGKTCSIQSLLPSYKFVERGSLYMRVALQGNGDVAPLDAGSDGTDIGKMIWQLGSLSAHAKVEAGVHLNLAARVATPDIQAIGKGASSCQWQFDRDVEPLYGRDIETWTVLALPRRSAVLKYSARFSLNIRTFLFTTKRASEWTSLTCSLKTGSTP
jgi:hypothetical protein